MLHKAWSSIEEVPYSFSRSSVKLQDRTALKIVELDPNWAFPDCNSSLNSPMAMKCCTSFEEVPYCFPRSSIKFQGHTGGKIDDWIQFEITRAVAAIKSLRFALFILKRKSNVSTIVLICRLLVCHWQPLYVLCRVSRSLSSIKKDVDYLHHHIGNILRPKRNRRHIAGNIFICILVDENMSEFRLKIHWNPFPKVQ